jgi:hypothetical protein
MIGGKKAEQAAEKVDLLTRPTPARRDAPFPEQRSRIVQILNVVPTFTCGGLAWDKARLGAPRVGGCEVWPF